MRNIGNHVQLMGNLGKDVEIISFDSGKTKANIVLATNEYYTNNKGEKINNTTWHNLVAWGKLAEQMGQILEKGSKVCIIGRLKNRSYPAKDGSTKYVTEVEVNEFANLTKKEVPF